jgi:hypothetical protein
VAGCLVYTGLGVLWIDLRVVYIACGVAMVCSDLLGVSCCARARRLCGGRGDEGGVGELECGIVCELWWG